MRDAVQYFNSILRLPINPSIQDPSVRHAFVDRPCFAVDVEGEGGEDGAEGGQINHAFTKDAVC